MSLSVTAKLVRSGFALDVALEAQPGVTALFGPSGAGKTTLARVIAGLEQGADAMVTLAGQDISALPTHQRNIGYVFQDARLFPHLTVEQNLLYGAKDADELSGTATLLDIAHLLARRPAGLSGGEAARVALGRALMRKPDLLILDEPLAGLDQRRKSELLPHFSKLRDAGFPILYISHAIEEVAQLADTLVLLRSGQVERAGSLEDILSDPVSAKLVGPGAAGAVLSGLVGNKRDGLTEVTTDAGPIWVPSVDLSSGSRIRLRLPASDVIVAVERPTGLSALNVLPAKVHSVHVGNGPGAMVALAAGEAKILARITRRSMEQLDLAPGREVWAVVKATGVARADIGN